MHTTVKAAAVQISPVLYRRQGTVEKIVNKIRESRLSDHDASRDDQGTQAGNLGKRPGRRVLRRARQADGPPHCDLLGQGLCRGRRPRRYRARARTFYRQHRLCDGRDVTANVVALEPMRYGSWPKSKLKDFTNKNPELHSALKSTLAIDLTRWLQATWARGAGQNATRADPV